MEMDARIWKLEWNILGTLLAVSTGEREGEKGVRVHVHVLLW